MNEKLKREDCVIEFNDAAEMSEFLKELTKNDVWELLPIRDSSLKPVEDEVVIKYGDEEDVKNFKENGGFYLSSPKGNYMLSPLSFFTMEQKLGINCRAASRMLDNREYEKFINFANIAFSIAKEKEEGLMLIRGNKVLAIHSAKYDVHEQDDLFERTKKHIDSRFKDNVFRGGSYSHKYTTAEWSLGGKDSSITKAYVEAWVKAGLDVSELRNFHPVISYLTSDVGVQSIEFLPQLVVDKNSYILGSPIKIIHYGGKTMMDVEESLEMVFAAIQDGAEKLGEMLNTEIDYPVEVFVAAAKAVGLHKVLIKLLKEQLEYEKINYAIDDSANAFLIYDSLCKLSGAPEYEKLSDSTKMRAMECFARLITLDWQSLDKPGLRDFD